MPNIPGVDFSGFAGTFSRIIYWLGIILAGLLMGGILTAVAYVTPFKIKATEFNLVGSGNSNKLTIGKIKKNRFKWNKLKDGWKPLYPLFNKVEVEPFKPNYVYSGKQVYVFKLGTNYIPGCLAIDETEKEGIKANINPVPHSIRKWQSIMHKQHAIEFAKKDFWQDNKYFIGALVTIAICCALVGVTVYYTYQFATGGVNQAAALTDAINNMGKNVIN